MRGASFYSEQKCSYTLCASDQCFFFLTPLYRLKKGKELEKAEAINEVKKNIHLIRAPHAGEWRVIPAPRLKMDG